MIPKEAIDRYLANVPKPVPVFKGVNERVLTATIYRQYGIPFKTAKTPLRGKHQLEGIAFALYLQQALLFYDTRLGKTFIALNWAEYLKRCGQWVGKGIVIVHAPIALDVWESEAPKNSSLKVAVVRTKLSELIQAMESDCDLVIVPWSGLQTIFTQKQVVKVRKVVDGKYKMVKQNKLQPDYETANLSANAFSLAIIDEIDLAKNKQTIRFKIAISLIRNCFFRLGLTGTPFGRNPFDLWAQAFLIDNGRTLGHNFNFFCEAFGKKKKGFSGAADIVFDKQKEVLLRQRMNSLALSYQRSEVHDVNILTGQIELHMSGPQNEAYESAIDRLITISDEETVEIRSVFVRLRQISSGYLPFVDDQGIERTITFPYNPKVEWLSNLIEAGLSTQFVIFHEFIRSGEIVCDVLKQAKVSYGWLYGGTPDPKEVVRKFTTGETQVLVANTVKGGRAIDLPTADYMIFWESPTSPSVRQQAESRPMSRGEKVLIIDDMICSGVERKIRRFLDEGRDLLTSLVHDRKSLREGNRITKVGRRSAPMPKGKVKCLSYANQGLL